MKTLKATATADDAVPAEEFVWEDLEDPAPRLSRSSMAMVEWTNVRLEELHDVSACKCQLHRTSVITLILSLVQ